ncbi:MAG: hypothetical protein IPN26_16235 [Bacteroidetes bacterium]|nr:hypothetical protein [Bacteroidota bacterium]
MGELFNIVWQIRKCWVRSLGEIDNMIHIVDSNGVDLVKKRFGTSRWDNQIKLQCDTANQLVYLCGFVDTAENELVYMTSMNYLPQNRRDNMVRI